MKHRSRFPSAMRSQRAGNILLLILGLIIVISFILAAVWLAIRSQGVDTETLPLITQVSRGPYEHVVLEQGEVESSNNVEIRCEVKNRAGGNSPSTSILKIVEEGTWVKEGDWLITFDAAKIENDLRQQRITANASKTKMIQAKADYETAVIEREEYLMGTYEQDRKGIQNRIFEAKENVAKEKLALESVERSVARGLVPKLQMRGQQFRVDAAQNVLDLAEQDLEVLDKYTKAKNLTQLESNIEAAKVRLENEEASYAEELTNLKEIEEQLTKCTVTAPEAGQVVYANVQSSRSSSEFVVEAGAAVRERQVIIRLPDPANMQVKAKVNEARVNLVRVGMPVEISIDAFGDKPLMGEVSKVNKYAEPGNWWSSTAKQYATEIKVLDPPPEIRSGLTAEVRIHVERKEDAMLVPVQAIFEKNGYTFCLADKGNDDWETVKVQISSANEKMISIDEDQTSGLANGQTVVLNPRQHIDKFEFEKFPEVFAEEEPPAIGEVAAAPTPSPGQDKEQPQGGGAGGQKRGSGSGRPSAQEGFAGFDTDSDGMLSSDEFNTIPAGLRTILSGADSDGDGNVSLAEWTAALGKLKGGGGGGGRPKKGGRSRGFGDQT